MYLIFNATDGITATPDEYKTFSRALEALQALRRRFQSNGQGFYRTAGGEHIDPARVELAIWKAKDFWLGENGPVYNDLYDPPELAQALGSGKP